MIKKILENILIFYLIELFFCIEQFNMNWISKEICFESIKWMNIGIFYQTNKILNDILAIFYSASHNFFPSKY